MKPFDRYIRKDGQYDYVKNTYQNSLKCISCDWNLNYKSKSSSYWQDESCKGFIKASGEALTHLQKEHDLTECDLCGEILFPRGMKRHQSGSKCLAARNEFKLKKLGLTTLSSEAASNIKLFMHCVEHKESLLYAMLNHSELEKTIEGYREISNWASDFFNDIKNKLGIVEVPLNSHNYHWHLYMDEKEYFRPKTTRFEEYIKLDSNFYLSNIVPKDWTIKNVEDCEFFISKIVEFALADENTRYILTGLLDLAKGDF